MIKKEPGGSAEAVNRTDLERIGKTFETFLSAEETAAFDDLLHAIDVSNAQSRGSKLDLDALSIEIESGDNDLVGPEPSSLVDQTPGCARDAWGDLGIERIEIRNFRT